MNFFLEKGLLQSTRLFNLFQVYLSPVLFIKDFNSLLSVMVDKADRH